MPIDAFVLRYAESDIFTEQFLSSPDFSLNVLKEIVNETQGRSGSKSKPELIDYILKGLRTFRGQSCHRVIMEQLTARKKEWLSVKTGRVKEFPSCEPATELVHGDGKPMWYGPVSNPVDTQATWYIRPVFVKHWEVNEITKEYQEFVVRWLCFARVTETSISLHWRGFSLAENKIGEVEGTSSQRNTQFPYWKYVPELFKEIETLTRARVDYVELHQLVLYRLWDAFIDDPQYTWSHRRIRAESSGVSLNAHAGGIYDINADGILHLARTVRKAVQTEMKQKYTIDMPDADHFDKVILRTLIREYGALSYEFSLDSGGQQLFRANCFFGQRRILPSQDLFPHLHVYISQCSDLDQMRFLLASLQETPRNDYPVVEQVPLF